MSRARITLSRSRRSLGPVRRAAGHPGGRPGAHRLRVDHAHRRPGLGSVDADRCAGCDRAIECDLAARRPSRPVGHPPSRGGGASATSRWTSATPSSPPSAIRCARPRQPPTSNSSSAIQPGPGRAWSDCAQRLGEAGIDGPAELPALPGPGGPGLRGRRRRAGRGCRLRPGSLPGLAPAHRPA